jgi:flagellar biosynthetic protein FlhB
MAGTDDRTEPASPKRRGEARKKGQVARGQDMSGAVVLLVGLFSIGVFGPHVVSQSAAAMQALFGMIADPASVTTGAGLANVENLVMNVVISAAAPIAGACMAAGLIANFAQVGVHLSPQALKPNFAKINPVAGAKNVFGSRIIFEFFKALAKVGVVGTIVAMTLIPQLTHLAVGVGVSPALLGTIAAGSAAGIAQRAAIAFVLIAVVDYVYQKRRHDKQLRMTKQEVKDEAKQHELPSEVKGAIRRRQIQAARKRMMAAVPQADVVVTNPTHFAVALKYDGSNPAPEVVAKGQDLVAKQIRRIAEESDVPVVENPPLARALHRTVEVGQLIPEDLYEAVAQVLAFVYRLARRRRATA